MQGEAFVEFLRHHLAVKYCRHKKLKNPKKSLFSRVNNVYAKGTRCKVYIMACAVRFCCNQEGFMQVIILFTCFRIMFNNFVICKCYCEAKFRPLEKGCKMIDMNRDNFFRGQGGYTLFDQSRNKEILEDLNVETVDEKLIR
jgi:hypothetical protein